MQNAGSDGAGSGAHSVRANRWQSRRPGSRKWGASALLLAAALLAAALLASGEAIARPDANSTLSVLNLGPFICELPGDALGSAGHHVPAEDFSIIHASTYLKNGRRGTYLLVGDMMAMTTGPLRGNRYRRITDNFLRKMNADHSDGELRCVRSVPNND